ncbi:hypothetical protein T484DRAFT_1878443, partial [Baffinella frigidus]
MRRAFLALIGAALLLASDRCPESEAAEHCAGSDPSLVAAVRVLGREQWALLEEDPAALRILLAARGSDSEPHGNVELAVHITAAPAMSEDGTFSADPTCSAPSPFRVQLDDLPIGVCAQLPCVLNTSCSVGGSHTLRVAPSSGGAQPQDLLLFSLGIEGRGAEVVGDRATEPASDRAAAASGSGSPAAAAAAAAAADPRGEWDDEANYVAILFPPDGACISDVAQAYLSIAITDNFFKLKGSNSLRARSETLVKCTLRHGEGGGDLAPAREDYDKTRDGELVGCYHYESDVELADGLALSRSDPEHRDHLQGMHDCPEGSVCLHDLEDGFMLDVYLVPPGTGGIEQLHQGMHSSRVFIVDASGNRMAGQAAHTTFFVDHGSGRVCNRSTSTPRTGGGGGDPPTPTPSSARGGEDTG